MDDVDLYQLPEKCLYEDTWDRHHSLSLATTKGLRNPPGENNCFLNSAVQVFWHLDVFRRSLKRYPGHVCMGNSCLFCNLKVIFTQLQYSDKSSLHPNALRRALAEAFVDQHRFQLGHMDDAAECFENILRRIHFHIANGYNEDQCNASHCLTHRKFSLTVSDQVRCVCGANSEAMVFSEIVHYVSVTALVSLSNKMLAAGHKISPSRFGMLLRNARSEGDIRDCPKNCGRKVPICRRLYNQPDVVSIGLVWNSDCPSPELISSVMINIRTTIYLQDMFHSSSVKDLPMLHLVGLVCYYGKHYSTFVFHTRDRSWYYFDDATVKEMGANWENVAEKICRSHYQPLLLLYANPNGTPINTAEAPQKVILAPGFKSAPNCIPRSQSADLRRAITPNPEMVNNYIETQNRRAITPGPETCHRYEPDRDSLSSVNTDHQRQPSFLMAISGQEDVTSLSSHLTNQGSLYDSFGSPSGPTSVQSSKPNSVSSEMDDQNLLGEYVCSNGMLQASFQQGGNPSAGGVYNVQQSTAPVTMDKAIEIQRQESFKKGNRIPADLIRYQVDNGFQTPDEVNSLNGRYQTGIAQSGGSCTETRNSQGNSQNGHNIPNNSHQILKPTAQNMNPHYYKILEENPLHSGLATLPRGKEQNLVKRPPSSASLVQPPPNSRPPSATPNSSANFQYRQSLAKEDSNFRGYYNGQSNRIVHNQQNTFGSGPFNGQMVRSASAHSLSSTNSRTNSESSISQPQKTLSRSYLDQDDSYDKDNYIDPKTVKDIMKRLHMKSPLPQRRSLNNGNPHVPNKNISLNADNSKIGLSEALTLEIPYDNVSLESHRDSGYGSSDRNSSSSTSSITMDPHYFNSISKMNLRNHQKDPPLHESQLKNLPRSKDDVYYMTQKRVLDHTLAHKANYLPRKGSVDSGLDGPMYPTDLTCNNVSLGSKPPSSFNNIPLASSSQNIRSTLLQQGKKLLPDKPVGSHIVRDARSKVIVPQPNPSPANGNDLISFKSGIQKNMNSSQSSSTSQDEYVQRCCSQVDELMDQCVVAEMNGELRLAICHCDKAIEGCKQVLSTMNLPSQAVNHVQNKHHACLMKRRTLFTKYSNNQSTSNNLRPSSMTPIPNSSAENIAVRNCMAGPLPLTSTSTSASSSYSPKDTFNNTSPMNGHCITPQASAAYDKINMAPPPSSKSGLSDCTSPKMDLPPTTVVTSTSRKSVDIYGTLPKNQPRPFENGSTSREAEVYQEFLSRQKQLNQQNGYGPSSIGRAYTPTPHSSSNYPSCPQLRPSSTIPVSHSRTDSTPESVASSDSVVTTVPGHQGTNKSGATRMNKHEIRQLLQQDMMLRKGPSNKSIPNVIGSHVQSNMLSSYGPHVSAAQSSAQDVDSINKLTSSSSSGSIVPKSSSSSYTSGFQKVTPCPSVTRCAASRPSQKPAYASSVTNFTIGPSSYTKLTTAAYFQLNPGIRHIEATTIASKSKCSSVTSYARPSSANTCLQNACFNNKVIPPIPSNNARPYSANYAPQQIPDFNSKENLNSKYKNDQFERQCEDFSRPSVKDLASKFEDVVSPKKNASTDNLASTASADDLSDQATFRYSFRMRSKSESSSTLPKPALSKHQFQQGSRPRKSVTFCDSIALISLTDDTYPYEVHTTTHRSLENESDSSSSSSSSSSCASDDGLDGGVSNNEGPLCSLCQKRQLVKGLSYCNKCSFYMSRFQPKS